MTIRIPNWIHTWKDLLRRLMAERAKEPLCYQAIEESTVDVQNLENAPTFSMGYTCMNRGKRAC